MRPHERSIKIAFDTLSGMPIAKLNSEQSKKVHERVYAIIASNMLRFLTGGFQRLHRRIYGTDCPVILLKIFTTKLLYDERPLGDRYTLANFARVAYESMKQYGY